MNYDDYRLDIYEHPQEGEVYALGGDGAEGLPDGDDSAAIIFNCSTGMQAAELQGKIPPIPFAVLCARLARYYNECLIGLERGQDKSHLTWLVHELKYPHVYWEARDAGNVYDVATTRIGWDTNTKTRQRIVNQGRRLIEDGEITIVSPYLLGQFETFALQASGLGYKYMAIPGAHDDLVMACLIAIEMARCANLREEDDDTLAPLLDGRPIDAYADPDGFFTADSIEEDDDLDTKIRKQQVQDNIDRKIAEQAQEDPHHYQSTVGDLV